MGLGTGQMETRGEASPRKGRRASLVSRNKPLLRLGKGPSEQGLESREASAFDPGGLPALSAGQSPDLTGPLASLCP